MQIQCGMCRVMSGTWHQQDTTRVDTKGCQFGHRRGGAATKRLTQRGTKVALPAGVVAWRGARGGAADLRGDHVVRMLPGAHAGLL